MKLLYQSRLREQLNSKPTDEDFNADRSNMTTAAEQGVREALGNQQKLWF